MLDRLGDFQRLGTAVARATLAPTGALGWRGRGLLLGAPSAFGACSSPASGSLSAVSGAFAFPVLADSASAGPACDHGALLLGGRELVRESAFSRSRASFRSATAFLSNVSFCDAVSFDSLASSSC
jgi:hypothetical protein